MAKAETYKKKIREKVAKDNGGKVPAHLDLTIENYARALEMRDCYADRIAQDGPVITEVGSMGQATTKQHPLCALLYQQELLCLNYAKALGATSATAASKTDPTNNDPDKLGDLLEDTNNVK